MSVWDITGALIWTPLALAAWKDMLGPDPWEGVDEENKLGVLCIIWAFTALAVFCIARLCGAHL